MQRETIAHRSVFAISLRQMASPEASQSVERTLKAEIKIYYDLHAAELPFAPLLVALHGYARTRNR